MNAINYEIRSKSDFLTGMYLTVRIPDEDVDENALLTIQGDCPEFILPFNYASVNGMTEFTYKVGKYSKLQYFYGDISHTEYAALWKGLLRPLLECKDWFMNPCSFVLSIDHLYYDKNNSSIAYIYIPSLCPCSGQDAFSKMAVSVAKNIKVADPVMENKVLRSIINDFNPKDFLKMLAEYSQQQESVTGSRSGVYGYDSVSEQNAVYNEKDEKQALPAAQAQAGTQAAEKAPVKPPAKPTARRSARQKKEKDSDSFKVFSKKADKKKETKRNGFKNTIPAGIPSQAGAKSADTADVTQETKMMANRAGLRCIGRIQLPQAIDVDIGDGEIFTIGRFDANIGRKQSSFEFEAKTKAVSRRHAAIERRGPVYNIVDLASSAGTFVNDKKIPPNLPVELKPGSRVSLGNMGADYVWEAI